MDIANFLSNFGSSAQNDLISLGVNPKQIGNILNVSGMILAGLITVVIITATLISYIKGTQYEPFMSSYEDDAFIRGKAGSIMGAVTIICAVWFLFSLVYLFFN